VQPSRTEPTEAATAKTQPPCEATRLSVSKWCETVTRQPSELYLDSLKHGAGPTGSEHPLCGSNWNRHLAPGSGWEKSGSTVWKSPNLPTFNRLAVILNATPVTRRADYGLNAFASCTCKGVDSCVRLVVDRRPQRRCGPTATCPQAEVEMSTTTSNTPDTEILSTALGVLRAGKRQAHERRSLARCLLTSKY